MPEKSDLAEIRAPEFQYEQFSEVLRLLPIQKHCGFTQEEQDVVKLCKGFIKVLEGDLSLEEVSSLYVVSIMLYLLGPSDGRASTCGQRLVLVNLVFNYSDTLKPTMIDYATRNLLESFKLASKLDQTDYMLHLIEVIPHMIVASDTGKMISLGLLRAFIAELLSGSVAPIVMHIYRSISEIWQMLKLVSVETMVEEWSLRKTYTLTKSSGLLINSAAFGPNNGLKQAGYRGFELPPNAVEMGEWFKALRNKLDAKYKDCKAGILLVQYIDFNILNVLSETGTEATA